jgi:hypothetical protein
VESRTKKLHQLLKRLGAAVHGSITNSEEVAACLRELKDGGWDAVMLMEASLVCRDEGGTPVEGTSLHIHVDPAAEKVSYRLSAIDARLLQSLGISPTRHRSLPSPARPASQESEPESE